VHPLFRIPFLLISLLIHREVINQSNQEQISVEMEKKSRFQKGGWGSVEDAEDSVRSKKKSTFEGKGGQRSCVRVCVWKVSYATG
jgi:hypothetical protein